MPHYRQEESISSHRNNLPMRVTIGALETEHVDQIITSSGEFWLSRACLNLAIRI